MKRKSCTLTASSPMVHSMSRSSHQAEPKGNGALAPRTLKDLAPVSLRQLFQVCLARPAIVQRKRLLKLTPAQSASEGPCSRDFSFPGSAWERPAPRALPCGLTHGRRSLRAYAFPGRSLGTRYALQI